MRALQTGYACSYARTFASSLLEGLFYEDDVASSPGSELLQLECFSAVSIQSPTQSCRRYSRRRTHTNSQYQSYEGSGGSNRAHSQSHDCRPGTTAFGISWCAHQ